MAADRTNRRGLSGLMKVFLLGLHEKKKINTAKHPTEVKHGGGNIMQWTFFFFCKENDKDILQKTSNHKSRKR